MIKITLTNAIVVYGGILFTIAVIIWIYTEMSSHKYQRDTAKQSLWRCTFCAYTYLDEQAETLSQCPRCESYNSAQDAHVKAVRQRVKIADGDLPHREKGSPNPSKQKRSRRRSRGPRKRR